MSPEVSRRLGLILGRHWVSPDERDRAISAALDVERWGDIPQEIRDLLAVIGKRGAAPAASADPTLDQIHAMAAEDDGQQITAAAGHDVTPGHDELHHYWTRGEGLAKWADSPTPWTTLYHHLVKYMNPEMAKRAASKWFIEIFHFAAGSDLNRVSHGGKPRGKLVGPG